MYFKVGQMVNLRLHWGYTVPSSKLLLIKIQRQFVGPFKVLERIGKLAYRSDIPAHWKIYPVISVAYLEPAPNPEKDPY